MNIIKKEKLFQFLKAESIIKEINNNFVEIEEHNTNGLEKVKIINLNEDSKYWLLNTENNTFIESKKRKVEKILLEYTNDKKLNIYLIELKSKTFTNSEIKEKFQHSFSWVYLLLNLLDDKEEQNYNVYGVLFHQKNRFNDWNTTDTLNVLSSLAIRYKKISFFCDDNYREISLNEI